MKTYVKPMAEIREFKVTNKIADLQSWMTSNSAEKGVSEELTPDLIASYFVNS